MPKPAKKKRQPVTAAPTPKKKKRPVNTALVPTKADGTLDYGELRAKAAHYYITSLDRISVAQLNDQDPFSSVSLHTMREWATKDGWTDLRRAFFERLQLRAAEVMAEKMVATRKNQIDNLTVLLEDALGQIMLTPPKTREGMMQAYIKAGQFLDDLTEKVSNAAQGAFSKAQSSQLRSTSKVKPALTKAEARAAAMAVIEKRQNVVRDRIAAGKPADEEL